MLQTNSLLSNPLKLIARVLNYARKHAFPEQRSAFTFWEEECPSRIDLGKSKYGGPFTFEEVGDVKTVLRLIPLVSCILLVISLATNTMVDLIVYCNLSVLRFWAHFASFFLIIFGLPAYQFLVYPFLYNYIPGMLRRIGFGLFVIALSRGLLSMAELYVIVEGHDRSENATLTCSAFENRKSVLNSWFVLASGSLESVGCTVSFYCLVEFVAAQTPCQMRGVVTSFGLGVWGILTLPQVILGRILNQLCVVYIALSVIGVGVFVLFVFLAKRYRLRVRNDVIPYRLFAEDQFESNYRQERDYLKTIGWLK